MAEYSKASCNEGGGDRSEARPLDAFLELKTRQSPNPNFPWL